MEQSAPRCPFNLCDNIVDPSINQKFEEFKAHGKLPSPRGVALQIVKLSNNDDTTIPQIAKIISKDPALAGRIVKAANLLVQAGGRPVLTITDAVAVLGIKSVRQLALSLSLVADFRTGDCKGFDYQKYWAHSACSGITAQKIVAHLHAGVPDEAFLLGLLDQIGRLTLATIFSDTYGQVIEQSLAANNLLNLEQEHFGITHNQLTELILKDWGMPEHFQKIALHLENPEQSSFREGERNWLFLQLFHFSDCVAAVCTAPAHERYRLIPRLLLLSTRIGIEIQTLAELGDYVITSLREWGELLNITVPTLPSFNEILNSTANNAESTSTFATQALTLGYKLNILLVDDERSIQLLYKSLLEKIGHHVTVASNGREALAAVKLNPPQLIISNWVMPEMDGIEFCKALRKNPDWQKIFVFILTAQDGADRIVEAFDAGANDYLTKPINEKVLAARIGAAQRVIQMQEAHEQDRLQLRQFADELAISNLRLQELAVTDELTGLPNRRHGVERLEQEWSIAIRGTRPVCCMMVDIDHFKSVNDVYGHQVGDDALKMISKCLRQVARKQDAVCRIGGEEFLVICPDTDAEAGFQYAERLRQFVSQQSLPVRGIDIHFTISIGLADNQNLTNVDAMLALADERLYNAKASGRNRTVGTSLKTRQKL